VTSPGAPAHHADDSIQRFAAHGVRAHHRRFGNIPAVEGLTRAEVSAIIADIRALELADGID
jgi:hypothetical protein